MPVFDVTLFCLRSRHLAELASRIAASPFCSPCPTSAFPAFSRRVCTCRCDKRLSRSASPVSRLTTSAVDIKPWREASSDAQSFSQHVLSAERRAALGPAAGHNASNHQPAAIDGAQRDSTFVGHGLSRDIWLWRTAPSDLPSSPHRGPGSPSCVQSSSRHVLSANLRATLGAAPSYRTSKH